MTSAADVDLFTVPAGKVAVIRTLTTYSSSGSGSAFWVLKGKATLRKVDSASGASQIENGLRIVLNAGDVLTVSVGSGTWAFTAHGYLLDA